MKKLITALALSLSSLSLHASGGGYLTNYGQGVEILNLHIHNKGGVTLIVNGSEIRENSCDSSSKIHIKPETPGYDAMLSTVLAAYMANKKVGFWSYYSNGKNNCEVLPFWGGSVSYPIVYDLWMVK